MLAREHLRDGYRNDEDKKNHIGQLEWWIVLIVDLLVDHNTEDKMQSKMSLWMNNTDKYEYTGHQNGYRSSQTCGQYIELLGTDIRYLSTETDPSAYDGTLYLPSVSTGGHLHSFTDAQGVERIERYYYNNYFLFN